MKVKHFAANGMFTKGRVKENEDHRKSEQEVNESLVNFFLRTRNLFGTVYC